MAPRSFLLIGLIVCVCLISCSSASPWFSWFGGNSQTQVQSSNNNSTESTDGTVSNRGFFGNIFQQAQEFHSIVRSRIRDLINRARQVFESHRKEEQEIVDQIGNMTDAAANATEQVNQQMTSEAPQESSAASETTQASTEGGETATSPATESGNGSSEAPTEAAQKQEETTPNPSQNEV